MFSPFADEIMAYRTVPLGTSEVLEISPESVDECTFYLTVTVGSSVSILEYLGNCKYCDRYTERIIRQNA